MIRQWNGLGGKCDFSPVMKPNCCRFLGSNPGSGGGEGGETGYQVKKGEVEVQKKREKGSPQKLGLKRSSRFWREEPTSFSKNKFLPRKSVFYREISSSLIIFSCQQTLQNQYFATPWEVCILKSLRHHKRWWDEHFEVHGGSLWAHEHQCSPRTARSPRPPSNFKFIFLVSVLTAISKCPDSLKVIHKHFCNFCKFHLYNAQCSMRNLWG